MALRPRQRPTSGVISLAAADVSTSVTAVSDGTTRRWIFDTSTARDGADELLVPRREVAVLSHAGRLFRTNRRRTYCGTAYFTDIHPGGGQALQDTSADGSGSPAAVPAACDGGPLTAEEKALEFLFFDQTECLISTGVIGCLRRLSSRCLPREGSRCPGSMTRTRPASIRQHSPHVRPRFERRERLEPVR